MQRRLSVPLTFMPDAYTAALRIPQYRFNSEGGAAVLARLRELRQSEVGHTSR